jgi:hypothetical protein
LQEEDEFEGEGSELDFFFSTLNSGGFCWIVVVVGEGSALSEICWGFGTYCSGGDGCCEQGSLLLFLSAARELGEEVSDFLGPSVELVAKDLVRGDTLG